MNDRLPYRRLCLAAILLLALVVRLEGIHNPILDHPGWRQGDTAAIARNFATLEYNPLHPQTDYNGPPPNYVELELQIVPFLAATLYKMFGVHEIFGRAISIAFSLGTVAVLARFGSLLAYGSPVAGIAAAALFAIYPGSMYYGRTFMPDTAMVFFLTAALFASTRCLLAEEDSPKYFWQAALLTALAILAKPVAIVALLPIAALMFQRWGILGTLRQPKAYAFALIAALPWIAYDHYVSSIAQWHWAAGIMRLHVIPSTIAAFRSWDAMYHELQAYRDVLHMLPRTMLGPWCTALFAAAVCAPQRTRSRAFLFAYLAACLVYGFVVMRYERVDYYFYVVLPLAALWSGLLIDRLAELIPPSPPLRAAAGAAALLAVFALTALNRKPVHAYYHYQPKVYRNAKMLDAKLAPGALVVMGHYDPSILYYINRKGWEEDPYLWTPFDEQSAIRKGARYFIAIENRRLQRNVELHAWLQRFPLLEPHAQWPVYETDYAEVLPGAEQRWQEFRKREKESRSAVDPMPSFPL